MKRNSFKIGAFAVVTSLVTALYGPQALAADNTTVTPTTTAAPTHAIPSDIELAQSKGAIVGYPGSSDLRAKQTVTRGELISMINRAAKLANVQVKKATYSDVPAWNAQAIENATAAGIAHGTDNAGHFQPNRAVTRQELAVMIGETVFQGQTPNVDQKVLNYFKDSASIPAWARPYVAYATLEGIFTPTLDGTFDGTATVTREEAAKALKPVLFNVVDILTTNDIHGHIEVGYDKKRSQDQGGLEIVGGIVNDYRGINSNTVVVDGGDMWQGTLISNTTNGQSVMDAMADIKYDAAAIGNHEFDFGRDTLINNIKNAKFPILGANIIDNATGKRVDWTQPYTIIERNGLKIGVIGFSTPQTVTTTKSTNIEGLSFVDPVPLAKSLSEELRAKGCDIIMVTSHLPGEQAAQSQQIMDELAGLANGTGNGTLDAIVGGHSHKRVSGIVNGIPVVEAQSWLAAVGHIQLYVDKDTKKVVSSSAGLLETYSNLTNADPTVQQTVASYKSKISTKANEVEAVAADTLTAQSYRFDKNGNQYRDGASPLGDLITDAMRASEGSDIAFTNIGGIRADVEKGDVTYSNMFEVLPFGNYDMTGTMTAQQVKKVLEVTDTYSKLPAVQFSGLKVEWDNTRPAGDKFTKITLTDGTPVYENGQFATRTFKVTTNDFMATGNGDGFKTFGEVKDWKDGAIMLDAWVKYVNGFKAAGKQLVAPNDGRDVRLDLK